MFALSSKQIQTSLNLIRLNVKHLNTIENKYRRIGPAGRILLKKFNIHESELPHLHFVSKGDVLEFLSKKEKSDTQIPRHKQIDTPVVNVKDESISNTINYLEYKNKLPHSYYSCTMKVDNLLEQMKEINEKHKKNVKLEDFIIKIIATTVNKRNNLKQVFDLKSSTSLHLGNEFSAYLQTFNKNFTVEVYTYKNPHKVSTSQIETVKEQLDINESTKNEGSSSAIPGPLFRVYNYSEVGIKMIDELIVPPALMSFSIGKPFKEIVEEEEGKINVSSFLTLNMTGVSSFIPEEDLCELLSNVAKVIESPLQLAL